MGTANDAAIAALTSGWSRRPGAGEAALADLARRIAPMRLPGDYQRFLLGSNGGSGSAGADGLYTVLAPIEEIEPYSRGCRAPERVLLIGSDGFGRALALDRRAGRTRFAALSFSTFLEEEPLGTTLLQALRTLQRTGRRCYRKQVRPEAPFLPSEDSVVEEMLALAQVTEKDLVYDLGCGDGRIVIAAARLYGARGVGFDVDRVRVHQARRNVRLADVGHLVTIRHDDLYSVDLSPADVVAAYLLPDMTKRLLPQLARLRPGARFVSHAFDLPDVPPVRTALVTYPTITSSSELYLWEAPISRAPRR